MQPQVRQASLPVYSHYQLRTITPNKSEHITMLPTVPLSDDEFQRIVTLSGSGKSVQPCEFDAGDEEAWEQLLLSSEDMLGDMVRQAIEADAKGLSWNVKLADV